MYFPLLRGKQFEFIALRELASQYDKDLFTPVIEPVRKNFSPFLKTLQVLNENDHKPVVIINPSVGDYFGNSLELIENLNKHKGIDYIPCLKISDSGDHKALDLLAEIKKPFAIFVTGGVDRGTIDYSRDAEITFVDANTSPLVINKLSNVVLIGDFFDKKSRNADYGIESPFSHLHVTYSDIKNVVGFGDYTVLPEEFSEGGGPAYVVTIHMSYVNENKFDEMFVRHYSSEDNGSPADPGGKFAEALENLMLDVVRLDKFYDTSGVDGYKKLHETGHFPGLGQVKKLSIKHHIETTCMYLKLQG